MWTNTHDRALTSTQRSSLYMWVNQKVPHRRLLHIMRRADSEHCLHCTAVLETIQHKFFGCPRLRDAFELLRRKLSTTTVRPIQQEELLRPSLERMTKTARTRILEILLCYINFLEECNDRVDLNALIFNFQVMLQ